MAFADLEPNPATMYAADYPDLERALVAYPEVGRPVEIYLDIARDSVRFDLLAEWKLNETRAADLEFFEDRTEEYADRIKRAIAAKQMALFWSAQGGEPGSLMDRKAKEWGRIYTDHRRRFAAIGGRDSGTYAHSIPIYL